MAGSFRQRGCKCPPERKRCTCGAKWYYRYNIIDPATGKRKQKEIGGFRTRREAEEKAKRIQYELQTGVYVEEKDTTFIEFVPQFLKLYESSGKVKPGSVRVRRSRSNVLIKYFGHIKLKDITKKMYQDMLNDLKEKGYEKETITSTHATGNLIFKKAKELGIIQKLPTVGVELPADPVTVEQLESDEEVPEFMEKEELLTFLEGAKDHGVDEQDYRMFVILAYTGMRVGELCVLKLSDIDRENKTISITKTLDNNSNNTKDYKIVPPKNNRARTIEVSDTVLKVLDDQRKWQAELMMKHRDVYYDGGFIFVKANKRYGNIGYPFMQKNIGERMERIIKILNMNENFTPHTLRHTHTSLLAAAGVNLETIQNRLGHKNDEMTKKVYLHVTKELKREASEKFEQLMGNI